MIRPMTEEYANYLYDESRTMGHADGIAFPRSEAELIAVVRSCARERWPMTVQGALTGLAGGASPCGGVAVNLSRMNRIRGMRIDADGRVLLRVEPGVLRAQVRKALENKRFDWTDWDADSVAALRDLKPGAVFFSPDPTEPTASIGGMAACNASGARSYLYGATRKHIEAIRVVLADGRVASLARGRDRAHGRDFELPCEDGSIIRGRLPDFDSPDIKDAGFYIRPDMDLVDLFIGSQGTLGILSELTIRCTPAPKALFGATAFLPDEACALAYVRALKRRDCGLLRPAAIEFFDRRALDLVEAQRRETPAFAQLQELPDNYACAVYTEFNAASEDMLLPTLRALSEILGDVGGDPARTWVARDERELEKLLLFRHAVPEAIDMIVEQNKKNEPCITILSTDMAVADAHFEELFQIYRRDLAASHLPYLIFGHIGENHVHPNILARDRDEYERGHALFERWAHEVRRMGGTITAEHGAGKIKRGLEAIMLGDQNMAALCRLKRALDPDGLLGPGNVLTEVAR